MIFCCCVVVNNHFHAVTGKSICVWATLFRLDASVLSFHVVGISPTAKFKVRSTFSVIFFCFCFVSFWNYFYKLCVIELWRCSASVTRCTWFFLFINLFFAFSQDPLIVIDWFESMWRFVRERERERERMREWERKIWILPDVLNGTRSNKKRPIAEWIMAGDSATIHRDVAFSAAMAREIRLGQQLWKMNFVEETDGYTLFCLNAGLRNKPGRIMQMSIYSRASLSRLNDVKSTWKNI